MWIPIVGPLIGGVLGAGIYDLFIRSGLRARGAAPDPEIVESGATGEESSSTEGTNAPPA